MEALVVSGFPFLRVPFSNKLRTRLKIVFVHFQTCWCLDKTHLSFSNKLRRFPTFLGQSNPLGFLFPAFLKPRFAKRGTRNPQWICVAGFLGTRTWPLQEVVQCSCLTYVDIGVIHSATCRVRLVLFILSHWRISSESFLWYRQVRDFISRDWKVIEG